MPCLAAIARALPSGESGGVVCVSLDAPSAANSQAAFRSLIDIPIACPDCKRRLASACNCSAVCMVGIFKCCYGLFCFARKSGAPGGNRTPIAGSEDRSFIR